MIFGLPGESREEMMIQYEVLNKLPLDNIKFHQLQIVKGTHMAKEYKQSPENFNLFGMEEYIDFIVEFLEHLNPNFVVERFAGEVPPRYLLSPGWGNIRNDQVSVAIEKKLNDLKTWQGRLYQG